MVFWHTSASHIIQSLDILGSQSLPLAMHYSSFRLHTLPTSMPSSAPEVDEPEDFDNLNDDPELQNEACLLERLEISPEVAEETMNEERDSSASVPGINEPSCGLTPMHQLLVLSACLWWMSHQSLTWKRVHHAQACLQTGNKKRCKLQTNYGTTTPDHQTIHPSE